MHKDLYDKEFIRRCSIKLGVSFEKLTGPYRGDEYCLIRYVFWLKLWSEGLTMVEIGKLFGRDHSSISQGVAKLGEYESSKDLKLISRIKQIRETIIMTASNMKNERESLDERKQFAIYWIE